MALSTFTSLDDIRAALGVSSEEIGDTTLSLPLYEFNLTSEMEEISLTIVADFVALPVDSSTWTAKQKRFNQYMRLFATYAVAKQATVSLPLFSPKDITDGKAAIGRWAQDPYKPVIARVLGECDKFRKKLEEAYADLNSTTATAIPVRSFMSVSSPNSNPITGT